MSGRVRFDPPVMLRSAGTLLAISEDLGTAAAAAGGVATGGLPPELASTARVVLSEAECDLRAAGTTLERDARQLTGRAIRAIALDDGGDIRAIRARLRRFGKEAGVDLRKFLKDLADPNDWDVLGLLNTLRAEGRKHLIDMDEALGRSSRRAWAQALYEKYGWVRRKYGSVENVQKQASKGYAAAIRRLERQTRLYDKHDPAGHLPKRLRGNPLVKRLPLAGDILGFSESIAEGRSVQDAAAKAATQRAAGAAGAAAGAAACGTAAAATLGLGAFTCPVLIGGGAAAADYLAGKAYDPILKPVANAVVKPVVDEVVDEVKDTVDRGKKVISFIGGLKP